MERNSERWVRGHSEDKQSNLDNINLNEDSNNNNNNNGSSNINDSTLDKHRRISTQVTDRIEIDNILFACNSRRNTIARK